MLTYFVIPILLYTDIQALICKPQMLEGDFSMIHKDGHVYLKCKVSSCESVSRITYEKTGIYTPTEWVPVYEGTNKTYYHDLDTFSGYTLGKRAEYSPFSTQHILNIKFLTVGDQGEWRCVVYDKNDTPHKSETLKVEFKNNITYDSECQPVISETSTGASLAIECEIVTCSNIFKIVYEKHGVEMPLKWTPVFEASHGSHFPLDTGSGYILNGTGITYHDHKLVIKNKEPQDQGEWRCVVYDTNHVRYASQDISIIIHVAPKSLNPVITPYKPVLVTYQPLEFTCVLDGVFPQPEVEWKVNGVKQIGGISDNTKGANGLWFVLNIITLDFDKTGNNILSCVITTEMKNPWMQNHIILDIKDQAQVSHPEKDINITTTANSTFTLNCTGSGYKPDITWRKDGKNIPDNDERYSFKKVCNVSVCNGSLTSKAVQNNDMFPREIENVSVYECVIVLHGPYQSFQTSPEMHIYVLQQARVLYPANNINITTTANSTFTLNCTGSGYKPDITWRKDGKIIPDNDEGYSFKKVCNVSHCKGSLTSKAVQQTDMCANEIEAESTGLYECIISSKGLYQYTQKSPPIQTYVLKQGCGGIFFGRTSWRIAGYATCLAVGVTAIVTTVVILVYRKKKVKRDIADTFIYDEVQDIVQNYRETAPNNDIEEYAEISDTIRMPTPSIYPDASNMNHKTPRNDKVAEHEHETRTENTETLDCKFEQGNLDVIYKRMDSQGRATYVTKHDMVVSQYIHMPSMSHTSCVKTQTMNDAEYIEMKSATYSNNEAMQNEAALVSPPTYMNKVNLDNKTKRRYSGILLHKPDFDILNDANTEL